MPLSSSQYSGEAAPRVLMMDDQRIVCEAVRHVLLPFANVTFRAVLHAADFFDTALAFNPTVILLDLDLSVPQISGLDLLRKLRSCPLLKDVPVVMLSSTEAAEAKQEAFESGANDYIVKLPETPELLARIGYHSLAYTNVLARNKAQQMLNFEMEEGSRYISSLFPEPMNENGVRVNWTFEASTRLAGDAFGYTWNDDEHFVFGLHDVCGHGVAAALHSVSVLNILRSHVLPGVDFADPQSVLTGLNAIFDMDRHGGKFFTLWYGVYHKSSRVLRFACGGHPPALLLGPASAAVSSASPHTQSQPQPQRLCDGGMALGVDPVAHFSVGSTVVQPGSRLYLFSDGVYEVPLRDGDGELGYDAFAAHLAAAAPAQCSPVALAQWVRQQQEGEFFGDDFTLLEIIFD